MLVKSEILHWNCDCSLHLDVLCSTTIFTIQRLKPEWNFTQEKRKLVKGHHSVTISADVWLLRVHIIYCRMINLSVYKVVVFLFFLCLVFFLVKQQFCGLLYSMNLMFAGSASWDSHIKGKSNLHPSLFSTKALLVEIWFCSTCAAHLCTGKHKS